MDLTAPSSRSQKDKKKCLACEVARLVSCNSSKSLERKNSKTKNKSQAGAEDLLLAALREAPFRTLEITPASLKL